MKRSTIAKMPLQSPGINDELQTFLVYRHPLRDKADDLPKAVLY
jgi:hypothetical protein